MDSATTQYVPILILGLSPLIIILIFGTIVEYPELHNSIYSVAKTFCCLFSIWCVSIVRAEAYVSDSYKKMCSLDFESLLDHVLRPTYTSTTNVALQ